MVEQSRWITPGISILKAQSHNTIEIDRVQNSLSASAVILEYVMADPHSYCLVISRTASRRLPLASKHQIETLVADYLKAVKAKQAAHTEARPLYDLLVRPISKVDQKGTSALILHSPLRPLPLPPLITPAF